MYEQCKTRPNTFVETRKTKKEMLAFDSRNDLTDGRKNKNKQTFPPTTFKHFAFS